MSTLKIMASIMELEFARLRKIESAAKDFVEYTKNGGEDAHALGQWSKKLEALADAVGDPLAIEAKRKEPK